MPEANGKWLNLNILLAIEKIRYHKSADKMVEMKSVSVLSFRIILFFFSGYKSVWFNGWKVWGLFCSKISFLERSC